MHMLEWFYIIVIIFVFLPFIVELIGYFQKKTLDK